MDRFLQNILKNFKTPNAIYTYKIGFKEMLDFYWK